MQRTTTEHEEEDAVITTSGFEQRARQEIAKNDQEAHKEQAITKLADPRFALVKRFCAALKASEESFFLGDQIQTRIEQFLATETNVDAKAAKSLERLFRGCSEIILDADAAYAVLRPGVGLKRVVRVHPELDHIEEVERTDYLEIKDAFLQGHEVAGQPGLILDFAPFFRYFPRVDEPAEMGEGISLLNRYLSAQLYQNPDAFRRALLDFMRRRHINGTSILVNDHLARPDQLRDELAHVRAWLEDCPTDEPYESILHELRTHGFEPGWGGTHKRIAENLALLAQVIESSEPARFEKLLGRLPLIRTVLMVSPHGWFAQDGVLGRPDTGGQVTYVLDQARAMEHQMRAQISDAGIEATPRVIILTRLIPNADGTTCNVAREKIFGTEDSWIVRAPFRDEQGDVISDWISRFKIWPYLEQFADDARRLVVTELLSKPDLIVGHYTDGNLVAHLLADALDTTHCACVHALEKTKYLLSDMHWADMEHEYHFSAHFTADLIAYNSSDFILSSSYREVGGTANQMGMIESYDLFSLPGLYRVKSGFDARLARHNIVPPGASEEYFFPNTQNDRRVHAVADSLRRRFFAKQPSEGTFGSLKKPGLPFVFAMARMDKIKNLSGLVELFGKNKSLREHANLLLVTSENDSTKCSDQEEVEEINRTYAFIEQYRLEGHIRWCAARLDKVETGEMYRIVADGKGVFAQPAFMETFGLTVIEAMVCGLPVVVTCYGGPAEIVIPGVSGSIENPNDHAAFSEALEKIVTDKELWQHFSDEGIARVHAAFTWDQHATKVMRLANIHTYWNYLDVMNRQALDQYIHTLYHTVYRPRARAVLEG